jgi:hypothetical protein
MLNGAAPTQHVVVDIVKDGYDDWLELLKHTNNMQLLEDPYNIWLEAFHVGTMIERHSMLNLIQTQVQLLRPEEHDANAQISIEDAKQLQLNILKQIVAILTAAGMQRQGTM